VADVLGFAVMSNHFHAILRNRPGPRPSDLPTRASDKGFLPMGMEDYLDLLDWMGRQASINVATTPAFAAQPSKAGCPRSPPLLFIRGCLIAYARYNATASAGAPVAPFARNKTEPPRAPEP
jgi:hypothetical protein